MFRTVSAKGRTPGNTGVLCAYLVEERGHVFTAPALSHLGKAWEIDVPQSGACPKSLFPVIEALTGQGIDVRHACRTLSVSESGYYACLAREQQEASPICRFAASPFS